MKKASRFGRNRITLSVYTITSGLIFLGLFTGLAQSVHAQGPMRLSSSLIGSPSTTYPNLVRFSLASPSVHDSRGQFGQRHRIPGTTYGGIEALHIEQFIGDSGFLSVDGRAIFDNEEYRLKVNLEFPEVGFAKAGIDNYRVQYDGDGGYFPGAQVRFAPVREEMKMDRGDTWIEGGLRTPGLPNVTLKYTRRFRDGMKPSLSWGDSNIGGEFGRRNISPAFWESDEVRNIFEGRAEYSVGATNLTAGVRIESGDIVNTLNVLRRPEESQERFLTETDRVDTDALDLHATTTTRLNSRTLLSTSYHYQKLDNDLSGDRIYGSEFGSEYDPLFPNRQSRDHAFIDLLGTTERSLHSARVNLKVIPAKGLTVVPALRFDKQEIDGLVNVIDTNVNRDLTMTLTDIRNTSSRSVRDWSGSLEVRYTAIPNVTVYARGDWLDRDGDIYEEEFEPEANSIEFQRRSDDVRTSQKYRAGASWYPSRRLKIAVQAFHRRRSVNYDHFEDETGPLTYPGFIRGQRYETDDANIQIRWKPITGISIISRLDFRDTRVDGVFGESGTTRSSEIESRIFSNSITWSPLARLFVQGTVTVNQNQVSTTISDLTSEAQAGVILQSENDYVSVSVSSALAVSNDFDIEGQYFYYRADNFVDNSTVGLPYGAGVREQAFSGGVTWHTNPELLWSARFYHFINRDETFGRLENYDLDLITLGVQYRF